MPEVVRLVGFVDDGMERFFENVCDGGLEMWILILD
jgi:hypothetical protein